MTRKAWTNFVIYTPQAEQWIMAGAQSSQQIRWPQGRKTMDTIWSVQIAQINPAFRRLFSSKSKAISAKIQLSKFKKNISTMFRLREILPEKIQTNCKYLIIGNTIIMNLIKDFLAWQFYCARADTSFWIKLYYFY